jgi:hypothetical protein
MSCFNGLSTWNNFLHTNKHTNMSIRIFSTTSNTTVAIDIESISQISISEHIPSTVYTLCGNDSVLNKLIWYCENVKTQDCTIDFTVRQTIPQEEYDTMYHNAHIIELQMLVQAGRVLSIPRLHMHSCAVLAELARTTKQYDSVLNQ